MSAGLQLAALSVMTILIFLLDGFYTLPPEDGDRLQSMIQTKRALSATKILLALILIAFSGWYLSKLLGAIANLLIFALTVLGASYFVHQVYDLPNLSSAFSLTLKSIFRSPYSIIEISEGFIQQRPGGAPTIKIGGPGLIKVAPDSAAVLVRNRESRVIGPGVHTARLGERLKEAVDLRPQTRTDTVKAMSKDGLEVKVTFFVGFQIDTGGRRPTMEEPHPFSEAAVMRAVYQSKQVAKDGAQLWHERVPGVVFANVREMIATHYLDEFFEPENPGSNPRTELKKWLFDASKGAAESFGAQLNWINFATPEVPGEAARKYVDRWQSKRQREMQIADASAEKKSAALKAQVKLEEAKAEAERFRQMAEAMQAQELPDEVISEVLTQAARHPSTELNELLQRYISAFYGRPDPTSAKLIADMIKMYTSDDKSKS